MFTGIKVNSGPQTTNTSAVYWTDYRANHSKKNSRFGPWSSLAHLDWGVHEDRVDHVEQSWKSLPSCWETPTSQFGSLVLGCHAEMVEEPPWLTPEPLSQVHPLQREALQVPGVRQGLLSVQDSGRPQDVTHAGEGTEAQQVEIIQARQRGTGEDGRGHWNHEEQRDSLSLSSPPSLSLFKLAVGAALVLALSL